MIRWIARRFAAFAHDRLCAGFRTPAALNSPHARMAGVRKSAKARNRVGKQWESGAAGGRCGKTAKEI